MELTGRTILLFIRRFSFAAAVIDYAKSGSSRDHLVDALSQCGVPLLVLTNTSLPIGWNAQIAHSSKEIVPRLVNMLEN
jgi:hypothetical protein